jgi:ubiquinol oxidase
MLNSSLIIKTCARRVANMTSSFNAANRALAIPALAAHQPSTNKISSTKKSVFSSRHLTRSFHNQRPAFLPADAIYGDQAQQLKKSSSVYHRSSTSYLWTPREVLKALDVGPTPNFPHKAPKTLSDKVAYKMVRFLRVVSDMYFKTNYLLRACMLETVAAVPGMVAGISHHLRSLRRLETDNWIKILLDEAENERMHLHAFMKIANLTVTQRAVIFATQGTFLSAYMFFYFIFPKTAHRFTGYLEEEAVKTYNKFLAAIDSGIIKNVPAPAVAIEYWGLPADATLRDVVLVVRADECSHRDVNHAMADKLKEIRAQKSEFVELNIMPSQIYSMEAAMKENSAQKNQGNVSEEVVQQAKQNAKQVEGMH